MHIHDEEYQRLLDDLRIAYKNWTEKRVDWEISTDVLCRLSLDFLIEQLGIKVVMEPGQPQ